ncbi:hypothetical protein SAMN05445060_3931 [Williamsia sterculiae]|uniref:Uncharacterized protein n=1 Tax=Williamsia sterculiae TaxID=1344003 RepID=A0A1N7HBI3_9NOCA|nr:hypothetical protein SAMN05445060_3931 [Williamsia sterculiae]
MQRDAVEEYLSTLPDRDWLDLVERTRPPLVPAELVFIKDAGAQRQ